jgi:hypothetical protein
MSIHRIVNLLAVMFVAAFLVSATGVVVYHFLWIRPAKACEKAKYWWDPSERTCARPLDLAMLTHRPLGQKRTPEEVEANRKRVGYHH